MSLLAMSSNEPVAQLIAKRVEASNFIAREEVHRCDAGNRRDRVAVKGAGGNNTLGISGIRRPARVGCIQDLGPTADGRIGITPADGLAEGITALYAQAAAQGLSDAGDGGVIAGVS